VIGIAAWTKADAQNVNFAIPAQEFAQLDVSKPLVTWDQLDATARPPSPSPLIKARPPVSQAVVEKIPAEGYSAFTKRLSESAGKPVEVIVQEEGQTNVYRFTAR
jgi:hypothetical protein